MRQYKYTLVRANGDVESCSIPCLFDPFEVKAKLEHSLVFLHIPRGGTVYANVLPIGEKLIKGPAVVLVENDAHWSVPKAPETDTEATRIWTQYGPQSRRAA